MFTTGSNAIGMDRKLLMMHHVRVDHQQVERQTTSSKDSVNSIIHNYLGKRKIYSTFVLCTLTDKQKATQMEIAGDFIVTSD